MRGESPGGIREARVGVWNENTYMYDPAYAAFSEPTDIKKRQLNEWSLFLHKIDVFLTFSHINDPRSIFTHTIEYLTPFRKILVFLDVLRSQGLNVFDGLR